MTGPVASFVAFSVLCEPGSRIPEYEDLKHVGWGKPGMPELRQNADTLAKFLQRDLEHMGDRVPALNSYCAVYANRKNFQKCRDNRVYTGGSTYNELAQLINTLKQLPKPCVLYSHNFLRYDARILLTALAKHDLHLPSDVFFIDTYQFAVDTEMDAHRAILREFRKVHGCISWGMVKSFATEAEFKPLIIKRIWKWMGRCNWRYPVWDRLGRTHFLLKGNFYFPYIHAAMNQSGNWWILRPRDYAHACQDVAHWYGTDKFVDYADCYKANMPKMH